MLWQNILKLHVTASLPNNGYRSFVSEWRVPIEKIILLFDLSVLAEPPKPEEEKTAEWQPELGAGYRVHCLQLSVYLLSHHFPLSHISFISL